MASEEKQARPEDQEYDRRLLKALAHQRESSHQGSNPRDKKQIFEGQPEKRSCQINDDDGENAEAEQAFHRKLLDIVAGLFSLRSSKMKR
jgi:hypothetical protein